jgi:hypothetical protein
MTAGAVVAMVPMVAMVAMVAMGPAMGPVMMADEVGV